ncbi:MAG: DUF3570 domain-containing protein [Verrucomicrobia bacterium]|nr:DUF3570 domain-containing protein [Verrucomicrobiota bacterium]MDA1087114.1 DUF3570 domain-containing protein [Verrucomicrobiota bacterium]
MFLKSTRLLLMMLAAGVIALRPSPGVAAEGDTGHGSVEFGLGFYVNADDGDGNPFLDEELTVVEPVVIFDYNVSDETELFGKLTYDYVSSASIDRLNKFPEQSGASGDYYFGIDLGLRRELDPVTTIGGFGSLSVEYDYVSVGVGGDYSKVLPHLSASYKWSANAFFDTIDVIRFDGKEEGSDNRSTLSTTLEWYQMIDPLTHAEFGSSLSIQNGFLESAFNAVVIEDTGVPNANLVGSAPGREVTEVLPDSRVRGAVFGRVRRSLDPLNAVEMGGRLYADSWGITSIALEPRWYRWLVQDAWLARLRYRLYVQTEADAYSEFLTTVPSERTQDSDLADFNAHTLGGLLRWTPDDATAWEFGVDYVLRSDGINQMLGRVARRKTF